MKQIYTTLVILFLVTIGNSKNTVAQTHVRTATKYTGTSAITISQPFTGASTTGNLIVVHLTWDNQSRFISSLTDNKGNTYARINGPTNWFTTYRSELWYAYNITGGGTPITITANLNQASTGYFQIYMSEFSGISTTSPLDQRSATAGSGAAASSGSKTTLYPNELIYGVSVGSSALLTKGASFTAASTLNENVVEYKTAGAAGSYNANFTSAGGSWIAEMATFRPSIGTLPVELLSFDALFNAGSVKLNWVTTSEISNDYFELQHSKDGTNWITVNKIKGAGNSNNNIRYSTTDNAPYAGLSYYRLIQFDFDGASKYSKIITVNTTVSSEVKIRAYPNPAVSYLTVEGDYGDIKEVSVANTKGEPVIDKHRISRESDTKININVASLSKGIYFLKTKNKCVPFYKD